MSGGSKPGVAPNHRSRARVDPKGGADGSSVQVPDEFQLEPMAPWRSRRCASLPKPRTNARAVRSYEHANQAVSGAGRKGAHLMLVGGRPGDKEDLAGKPFVHPAIKDEADKEREYRNFVADLRGAARLLANAAA